MSNPHKSQRRRTLIKPRLQLWMCSVFLGLSALSLLMQFVLFTNVMQRMATSLPNDGPIVMQEISGALLSTLGVSFLVFLPLTLIVGVLCTFKVAGPVYRFETFLNSVIAGEKPVDFRIRKRDRLHDLAGLINDATRPLRAEGHGEELGEAQRDAA